MRETRPSHSPWRHRRNSCALCKRRRRSQRRRRLDADSGSRACYDKKKNASMLRYGGGIAFTACAQKNTVKCAYREYECARGSCPVRTTKNRRRTAASGPCARYRGTRGCRGFFDLSVRSEFYGFRMVFRNRYANGRFSRAGGRQVGFYHFLRYTSILKETFRCVYWSYRGRRRMNGYRVIGMRVNGQVQI